MPGFLVKRSILLCVCIIIEFVFVVGAFAQAVDGVFLVTRGLLPYFVPYNLYDNCISEFLKEDSYSYVLSI